MSSGCKAESAIKKRSLTEYKLYVAEHYASKDFLLDLKREITASIRDLGRRIDTCSIPIGIDVGPPSGDPGIARRTDR
jgi:hypothetical protein